MVRRCTNPDAKSYELYGGRGIGVCPRWTGDNGFAKFLADMGNRPGKQYSIDRLDPSLGYSKENCRWATAVEQVRNRRCTRYVSYNGEKISIGELAERFGVNYNFLAKRIFDYGWSVDDAVSIPSGQRRPVRSGACLSVIGPAVEANPFTPTP